jgi:CheY-like chemotaxis protein
MTEEAIAGRRILIVEDEFFVADSLKMYLEALGVVVVGPAASVEAAVDLVAKSDRLDGAVLDVNLQGKKAYPVAEALSARGVPFVFVTGYGRHSIPERFASAPRCTKPFELAQLVRLLAR